MPCELGRPARPLPVPSLPKRQQDAEAHLCSSKLLERSISNAGRVLVSFLLFSVLSCAPLSFLGRSSLSRSPGAIPLCVAASELCTSTRGYDKLWTRSYSARSFDTTPSGRRPWSRLLQPHPHRSQLSCQHRYPRRSSCFYISARSWSQARRLGSIHCSLITAQLLAPISSLSATMLLNSRGRMTQRSLKPGLIGRQPS